MLKMNILALFLSLMPALAFGCAGGRPKSLGVKDGRLAPCPKSPNCVCSQDSNEKHRISPIAYEISREEALTTLKRIIQSGKRTKIVTETQDYLHVEFKSVLFGFVDDVEFYFPDGEKIIHVRSASRVGYSDLGVNRRRIEDIRTEMRNR